MKSLIFKTQSVVILRLNKRLLPRRVPLSLPCVVIDAMPSPVSVKMTCTCHVLKMHFDLSCALLQFLVWLIMVHDGGRRSGSCKV